MDQDIRVETLKMLVDAEDKFRSLTGATVDVASAAQNRLRANLYGYAADCVRSRDVEREALSRIANLTINLKDESAMTMMRFAHNALRGRRYFDNGSDDE